MEDKERNEVLAETGRDLIALEAQVTAIVELMVEKKLLTQREWIDRLQIIIEQLRSRTKKEAQEHLWDETLRRRPKQ